MTSSHDPAGSRGSKEDAAPAARDLQDEAKETGRDLKDRATATATRRAESAKDSVADEISDIGDALRRASEEVRDGSPQDRTFGYMASTLADFSDAVRGKDVSEIVDDLSDLARRNPEAFLGGAALLGFTGVRLSKASRRHRERAVDMADWLGSDEEDDALEAELFGPGAGSSTAGHAATETPPARPQPAATVPPTRATAASADKRGNIAGTSRSQTP